MIDRIILKIFPLFLLLLLLLISNLIVDQNLSKINYYRQASNEDQLGSNRYFFIQNKDEYIYKNSENEIFFRKSKFIIQTKEESNSVITIDFKNSNQVFPIGYSNQLNSNRLKESSWNEIWYYNIYNGIDLKFYFQNEMLKYDLVVKPGFDPEIIEFQIISSIDEVRLDLTDDSAKITSNTSNNVLFNDRDLFVYQESKNQIAAKFEKRGDLSYGFNIGKYNKNIDLIIDPIILSSPSDMSIEYLDTGYYLNWVVEEENFNKSETYIIYINGDSQVPVQWFSHVEVSFSLDGLSIGIYNITISFSEQDTPIVAVDQVWVIVKDTIPPETISSPINQSVELGDEVEFIWEFQDALPDTYEIYHNGVIIENGFWDNDSQEIVYIEFMELGTHIINVFYSDTSGNVAFAQTIVLVIDTIVPVLNAIDHPTVHEFGDEGTITWEAYDLDPGIFYLYKNDGLILSGFWESNTTLEITLSGYQIGNYSFQLHILDISNNSLIENFTIDIVDTIMPSIFGPDTLTIELGDSFDINWIGLDLNPDQLYLYLDGNLLFSSGWTSNENIYYSFFGHSIGVYEFEMILFDGSLNTNSLITTITVIDTVVPALNAIDYPVVHEFGDEDSISWEAFDLDPGIFHLYKNDGLVLSGFWESNTTLEITLSDYQIGNNSFQLHILDKSNNSLIFNFIIEIVDTIIPTILGPDTLLIELGDRFDINWIGIDLNPDQLYLYLNGSLLFNSGWISNETIYYSFFGQSIGVYEFEIILFDGSLNTNSLITTVTVIDTVVPVLNVINYPFIHEFGDEASISWEAYDLDPGMFYLYKNDGLILSGFWESYTTLEITLSGYQIGNYTFQLQILDKSNNSLFFNFIIEIVDTTIPLLTNIQDFTHELGEHLIMKWMGFDFNPHKYEIYVNNSLHSIGVWINQVYIDFIPQFSQIGYYNITLILYDSSFNYNISITTVFVNDTISPIILEKSDNLQEYLFESSEINLFWLPYDKNPKNYQLFLNEQLFISGSWQNNYSIIINLDHLQIGTHMIEIIIYDINGNYISDLIIVNVYIIEEERNTQSIIIIITLSLIIAYLILRRQHNLSK
jgi:hypothetical protein